MGAGFAISRRDLQLRGPSNLFGESQKGSSRARVDVSQYNDVVRRVAAASNLNAAATSFANEADATGLTTATSLWEVPTLPELDVLATKPTPGGVGVTDMDTHFRKYET